MKKKNRIFSGFMMLVLALTCLSIATYAWFSMANKVEATTPELTASAPENMQISSDAEHWATAITVDLGDRNDLALMPASSYTGIKDNIFYTDSISEGTSSSTTKFDIADVDTVKGTAGYYKDVDLWIRTTGTEPVKVALDVNATEKTFVKDLDDEGNVTTKQEISPTVRIGFISPDLDANSLKGETGFTGNEPLVYTANKNFIANGGQIIKSLNADNTGVRETPVYLTNTTQMLAVPAFSDSHTTGTHFVARIWLEGEDPNCIFDNGGKSFAISLRFIALNN